MPSKKRDTAGFLNTSEVADLTGRTRTQLNNYVKRGLVNPARVNDLTRSDWRWSIKQSWQVRKISTLVRAGCSLDDIKSCDGTFDLNETLIKELAEDMREGRRCLKDLRLQNYELTRFRELGTQRGQYLRYLPQRMYALLPLPDEADISKQNQLTDTYADIIDISMICGWGVSELSGIVTSTEADNTAQTRYAAIQLAAPPMPYPTENSPTECGCYHDFGGRAIGPACEGDQCATCVYCGQESTSSGRMHWKEHEGKQSGIIDRTVMLEDLHKPYATGAWAECTREEIKKQRGADDPPLTTCDEDAPPTCTVRPRLMPHDVRLPLNVTAAELPAGVYLCTQCDEEALGSTVEHLRGLASALTQHEMTEEEELERGRRLMPRLQNAHPPVEGFASSIQFATPVMPGEEGMFGWHHKLASGELQGITLPTATALAPETGYCIVCSALPTEKPDDEPRYEVELLVDVDEKLLQRAD